MSNARELSDLVSAAPSTDASFDGGTLYIDRTNNRVGIGTSSPATALDVDGNIVIADSGTIGSASATSAITISAAGVSTISSLVATTADINGGTIDGAVVTPDLIKPSGGRVNTGSSANWFNVGTITNLVQSGSVKIKILGTSGFGEIVGVGAGETTILLRGDNADAGGDGVIGYFYGETLGGNTVTGVAVSGNSTDRDYTVYVKSGSYANIHTYVSGDCDGWTPANTDTGSTTQPAGSTLLPSQRGFTTAGVERMRIDSSGLVRANEFRNLAGTGTPSFPGFKTYQATTQINTGISVNGAPFGKTLLVIWSIQGGAAAGTTSGVHMIWCGYDGENWSATQIAKTGAAAGNVTYSLYDTDKLRITANLNWNMAVKIIIAAHQS